MTLRTFPINSSRRRRPRRNRTAATHHWSLLPTLLPFVLPLGILFTIVVFRVRFESETEELCRKMNQLTQKIHEQEQDIRNMRYRIEHRSRRQFIFQQVERFNLAFRNPQPGQVRNLDGSGPASQPAAATGNHGETRQLMVSQR